MLYRFHRQGRANAVILSVIVWDRSHLSLEIKWVIVLMAHLILSSVSTVSALWQRGSIMPVTHLVLADADVIVQLQLLSFETSLQPGKCVSSKCLYASPKNIKKSLFLHNNAQAIVIPYGCITQ